MITILYLVMVQTSFINLIKKEINLYQVYTNFNINYNNLSEEKTLQGFSNWFCAFYEEAYLHFSHSEVKEIIIKHILSIIYIPLNTNEILDLFIELDESSLKNKLIDYNLNSFNLIIPITFNDQIKYYLLIWKKPNAN